MSNKSIWVLSAGCMLFVVLGLYDLMNQLHDNKLAKLHVPAVVTAPLTTTYTENVAHQWAVCGMINKDFEAKAACIDNLY